jgi:hypothetical protein
MKPSVREVIENSDIVIVSKTIDFFKKEIAYIKHDTFVIDLVGIHRNLEKRTTCYDGICW